MLQPQNYVYPQGHHLKKTVDDIATFVFVAVVIYIYIYIYIYILSSTERLFNCITTLQCG